MAGLGTVSTCAARSYSLAFNKYDNSGLQQRLLRMCRSKRDITRVLAEMTVRFRIRKRVLKSSIALPAPKTKECHKQHSRWRRSVHNKKTNTLGKYCRKRQLIECAGNFGSVRESQDITFNSQCTSPEYGALIEVRPQQGSRRNDRLLSVLKKTRH